MPWAEGRNNDREGPDWWIVFLDYECIGYFRLLADVLALGAVAGGSSWLVKEQEEQAGRLQQHFLCFFFFFIFFFFLVSLSIAWVFLSLFRRIDRSISDVAAINTVTKESTPGRHYQQVGDSSLDNDIALFSLLLLFLYSSLLLLLFFLYIHTRRYTHRQAHTSDCTNPLTWPPGTTKKKSNNNPGIRRGKQKKRKGLQGVCLLNNHNP